MVIDTCIFPIRIYKLSELTDCVLSSVNVNDEDEFSKLILNPPTLTDNDLECTLVQTTVVVCDLEDLQPECDWFISIWNRLYGGPVKLKRESLRALQKIWQQHDQNATIIIVRHQNGQDPQPVLETLSKYRIVSLNITTLASEKIQQLMHWCRLACMTPYTR